jgi:Flp pilus assembly protein CpaB
MTHKHLRLAILVASTWVIANTLNAGLFAQGVQVKVLVPIKEVQPYSLFDDEKKFTAIEWPKEKLREAQEDTITSFDQIKGKTSRHYRLRPNEPFYKNDVCEKAADIADRLHDGEVAQFIRLSPNDSILGFVDVGNHVDISATFSPKPAEPAKTKFILQDIEVLAVDHFSEKGTGLVLRVTRDQSLILKNYQEQSKLDAVKRKPGDPQRVTEVFTLTPEKTATITETISDRLKTLYQDRIKLAEDALKKAMSNYSTGKRTGGKFGDVKQRILELLEARTYPSATPEQKQSAYEEAIMTAKQIEAIAEENVSAQLTVFSDKYDAKQFRLSLEIRFEEFKLNTKKQP